MRNLRMANTFCVNFVNMASRTCYREKKFFIVFWKNLFQFEFEFEVYMCVQVFADFPTNYVCRACVCAFWNFP